MAGIEDNIRICSLYFGQLRAVILYFGAGERFNRHNLAAQFLKGGLECFA
ncbi:hypothetical protein SDC9_103308 [bioreactor metagenome]|uniref:Uncharacterized protein n=1 Tax=bioreactor metagenome TaxID=1076179 RepID=A0A645ATA3_9ZZZZ